MARKSRRRALCTYTLSAEAVAALADLATAAGVSRSRWLENAILGAQAQRRLEAIIRPADPPDDPARRGGLVNRLLHRR